MTETVAADIAAAVADFDIAAQVWGRARRGMGEDPNQAQADYEAARSTLIAVMLKYAVAAAEMKAALERIEQGV